MAASLQLARPTLGAAARLDVLDGDGTAAKEGIDQLVPVTPVGSVVASVIEFDNQGDPALPVDDREIHGILRHPAQRCPAQGRIALDDFDSINQAHLGAHVVAARQVRLDFCQCLGFPG
jgi:hypothetical protein